MPRRSGYKTTKPRTDRGRNYVGTGAAMRDVYLGKARVRSNYSAVPRTIGWVGAGEKKYTDTGYSGTVTNATTWTAATDCSLVSSGPGGFCIPTPGSGINQRIGRKVRMVGLRLRGTLSIGVTSAGTVALPSPTVRLILVRDKQTNAATLTPNTVIQDPTGAASSLNAINAFQSLASLGRFKVYKDKFYSFSAGTLVNNAAAGSVSQSWNDREFKMNLKFPKGIIINFNSTTAGTIGDVVDNSFHLLALVDDVSPVVKINFEARSYYYDV